MHKTLKGAVVALGLAGAALAMTGPASAQGIGIGAHVGDVGIGIGIGVGTNYGNVAYGYQDGYWDHHHAWHAWRNQEEMDHYRAMQGNRYNDWHHDRDPDQGWHDEAK